MKNLKFQAICLVLAVLFISSCKEQDPPPVPATIEIVFKGKYIDQPLVFDPNFTYDYYEGSKIGFTRSEFFVDNFELLSASKNVNFGELRHIKLQDKQFTLEKAKEGYKLSFLTLAEGTFDGISFHLGLTPEQNRTNPTDYKGPHVLADGDNYWSGWNSYIFSKTEGSLSNSNTNVSRFAYHSGFNQAFRKIKLNRSITIKDGEVNTIVIDIDHREIFGKQSDYVNIYQDNIIHEDIDFIIKFMDQFSNSFK
ncbi:MAG: hypothetical protein HOP11_09775 [Saprospiraceae bacterium]|nr:hypothetical protein [Saprospiraceae bacterium]